MPTISVEFLIAHVAHRKPTSAHCVHISDLDDFWHIVDMGFLDRTGVGHGNPGGRAGIKTDESDPRLDAIFKILAKHGYSPTKRRLNTIAGREHEFEVIRHRSYSDEEIAAAPLLMLMRRLGPWRDIIANWYGYREGGGDDHGWIAKADKRLQKKTMEIGHFDCFEGLLLGPRLHELLMQSGLAGLDFIPVQYDHPERATRQLWQFGHKVVLPGCLLPRQGVHGLDYLEGDQTGAYWDEGGYEPQELRFHRREVEALGEFDVARTKEKIGINSGHYRAEVIVSQRFREVLEKAGIKTIDYVPVRLVD